MLAIKTVTMRMTEIYVFVTIVRHLIQNIPMTTTVGIIGKK